MKIVIAPGPHKHMRQHRECSHYLNQEKKNVIPVETKKRKLRENKERDKTVITNCSLLYETMFLFNES